METARRAGSSAALHACACFTEQLLADAAAGAAEASAVLGGDLEGVAGCPIGARGPEVRSLCTALAREMAADPHAPAREPDQRLALLTEALTFAATAVDALWRSDAAGAGAAAALLQHAADWKTPECYGYDLADPELMSAQAARWLAARPGDGPVLVVAVRTGGSYLAPFWQAAAEDAGRAVGPWHSVRPLRGPGGIDLPAVELRALPAQLPVGTDVVLVDDQPDTGATALAVRERLRARFPGAGDVVLSSPGRLYDLSGPHVRQVFAARPVHRRAGRLWELPVEDAAGVVDRARAVGVRLPPGGAWRVEPFRGEFAARYGATRRGQDGPQRVDPRNRPFTLTAGPAAVAPAAGPDDHHFRFIGTGTHGLHCYRALRSLPGLLPPDVGYADGYLITRHESGLSPLRTALPTLPDHRQREVLASVVRSWLELRRLGELGRPGPGTAYDPRTRLAKGLDRLRDRMGRRLPVDDAWLVRHVPDRVPVGGSEGTLFRTPLPYGHGDWHWQLAHAHANGEGEAQPIGVRRFGLDWIWGGSGSLESEVASFVVENRLRPSALRLLEVAIADALGDSRVFDGGLRLAGEALHWNVKSWLRRCPDPDAGAIQRIESELVEMARYASELT